MGDSFEELIINDEELIIVFKSLNAFGNV